jgi:formate dehydrogenase accessory protein FdhD
MGTGHTPAQAVVQAAYVGIPIPASRSATTAQAIALAERVGVAVIAFVRTGLMSVRSNAPRVIS